MERERKRWRERERKEGGRKGEREKKVYVGRERAKCMCS